MELPKDFTFSCPIDSIETKGGDVYNLKDPAGLLAFSRTSGASDIYVQGATVYRAGWNRNAFGLHPKELGKYAKTAKNKPILFEHDPRILQGVGTAMRAMKSEDGEYSALVQDMQLTGAVAKNVWSLGIKPSFSIHLQLTEKSEILCSVCGKNLMTPACEHFPGQAIDGQVAMGLFTNCEHAETSLCFDPAVPGTDGGTQLTDSATLAADICRAKKGNTDMVFAANTNNAWNLEIETAHERIAALTSDNADLAHRVEQLAGEVAEYVGRAAEYSDELVVTRAELTHVEEQLNDSETARLVVTGQLQTTNESLADVTGQLAIEMDAHGITRAKLTAAENTVDGLSRDLNEVTSALGIVRGELQSIENDKAEQRVVYWRRKKGLAGPHDHWLSRYKADPEQFEADMAYVPDSLLSAHVTGAESIPEPALDYATMQPNDIDAAASRLAADTGRSYQQCWAEVRNRVAAHQRRAKTSRHEEK